MHLLTLETIKLENKQPNSLTNFVRISTDWAAFLLSKFGISFAVFFFFDSLKGKWGISTFYMNFNCNNNKMVLILVNSILNRIMRSVCNIKEFIFGIYP